ncbi:hypothetical protein J3458_018256 [Metarhizium acridum]|uniref:uncharacterized protein n=1 Tax=Metarhizium acridum TaxID=92637 RepID=UPI001C6D0C43|nr:hypothetical protein J3458_018256 [Metarhizium acridum]
MHSYGENPSSSLQSLFMFRIEATATSDKSMDAFHPFPRLPYEIRAIIWALAVEPRTVDVRAISGSRLPRGFLYSADPREEGKDPYVPVFPPAILHTCREARQQNIYQKVFYSHSTNQPEERYTWINYDTDMIDIGLGYLETIQHIGSAIRRLRLNRENSEFWFWTESKDLEKFPNVVEYHLVAEDNLESWCDAWDDFNWSCEKQSLKFIDKETGQVMDPDEIDDMMAATQYQDPVYGGVPC